mgnify:CR=1 FL=1
MSTSWERLPVNDTLRQYLKGTHILWSRIMDGDHIFTVRPVGETPGDADGGSYSIASAFKSKGMMS